MLAIQSTDTLSTAVVYIHVLTEFYRGTTVAVHVHTVQVHTLYGEHRHDPPSLSQDIESHPCLWFSSTGNGLASISNHKTVFLGSCRSDPKYERQILTGQTHLG